MTIAEFEAEVRRESLRNFQGGKSGSGLLFPF
jgi:hypothetical protein